MNNEIMRLKANGQHGTSQSYSATLHSFKSFRLDKDISFRQLSPEVLADYQAYLKGRGNTLNTVSFYMRVLRACFNRANERYILNLRYSPFKSVYTGIAKTAKRNLSVKNIRQIRDLDLSRSKDLAYARDIFLLSFYLRGMSFVDMAFLKKSDLQNGYISYRRRKTGQYLSIKWTREMAEILEKYPQNPTEYLLPIITSDSKNEYTRYKSKGYMINRNLKTLGRDLKLPVTLTLYVARHSWATAAKFYGIPVSIISEGLGHSSETATRIYLASLDRSRVDSANSNILKSLSDNNMKEYYPTRWRRNDK